MFFIFLHFPTHPTQKKPIISLFLNIKSLNYKKICFWKSKKILILNAVNFLRIPL